MSKRKTELVVKSNKMIEASYRLTLVEQQIILFAICRHREEQKGFSAETSITITATDFATQFHTNADRVYSQLKEAIGTLYDRSITIHDIDPITGGERVTETRWISDKSYIDGHGQIQLTFAPKVIPFITRLGEDGNFTSYRLEKIGGMSSTHAVRLYELLVQYLSIGKREIEISWLKETLQLNGQYKAIKDFKKYVIDLSVTQINKYSDITVSYTQKKSGVSVTHFIFDIKEKVDKAKQSNNPIINREYIDRHANPGESYDQAYQRLNKNNKLFLNEKIIQKNIISTENPSLIVSSNTIENEININTNNKEHIINELDKLEECVTDKTSNNVLAQITNTTEDQDKLVKPWWKFW
jgi:plasmid replication initiation protein